jgi:hypothetical protein
MDRLKKRVKRVFRKDASEVNATTASPALFKPSPEAPRRADDTAKYVRPTAMSLEPMANKLYYFVRSPTLWQKALNELPLEDKENTDIEHGSKIRLLEKLLEETEKKKEELDSKRWGYINREGEKVFIADLLLGQLNRYAAIGDIAIQHDPQVVALAWAGFRFILNVSRVWGSWYS